MAYIGKAPNTAIVNQTTSQSFNGTGSATAFTLNRSVNVSEDLEVFVDNVQQEPGSGKSYTASGTTLTFDEAPPSGTGNIYVIYRGEATINPRLEHDANAALAATTGTFTGNLTVDTNTLHVDAANNRVGVGTASPSAILQIDRASANFIRFADSGSLTGLIGLDDGATLVSGGADGDMVIRAETSGKGVVFAGNGATRFGMIDADGLKFNTDTAAANALDDYEYGTFDPDVACSGTNFSSRTISTRGGYYEKVGNAVSTYIYFELSAFTLGSGSGNVKITGLPFSASTARAGAGGGGACAFHGVNVGSTVYQAMAYAIGSEVLFLVSRDQDSWVNIQIGDIHSGTIFAVQFQLNYYVD